MDAAPPTAVSPCPPHHWLIDQDTSGRERWSCQRCGLVRDAGRGPAEARRLVNVCTWSRDEVALLDDELV